MRACNKSRPFRKIDGAARLYGIELDISQMQIGARVTDVSYSTR